MNSRNGDGHSPVVVIHVTCERREDGGLYLSSDQMPGLHVAHSNPQMAIEHAVKVIERLVKLEHGIDVTVRPAFGMEALGHSTDRGQSADCPAGFIIDAIMRDAVGVVH